LGHLTCKQYDSIQGYESGIKPKIVTDSLTKRVFGYHPYWIGSAWQNYQWDLLTDLCYFSYEVDPNTGNALTTNGFETAAVVDTAMAHGVSVHLCVTLFSGHAAFFASNQAQQALITNLIELINSRHINGINLDFEAVPSSQQAGLTSFIQQFSQVLHTTIPEAELSIAAPAVNWNNTFDLQAIAPSLDLIMIMAYDYYWNGSSTAGPVAGLWPLTSSYPFAADHTLAYYLGQGIKSSKLLLGVPYYGRDWPVVSDIIPAQSSGSGSAYTYKNIRSNSSGYFTTQNLRWDTRSYNPYYAYNSNSWHQCFFDDNRSLAGKYALVNKRNAGGIGIWALGYDNGYNELWMLIKESFTARPKYVCQDTLYDTGGPAGDYGNHEMYTETVYSGFPGPVTLRFLNFNLEPGYDSLWIFDGMALPEKLTAALSGSALPSSITTTGNMFSLRFYADGATTADGYALEWSCPSAAIGEAEPIEFSIYPNPASHLVHLYLRQMPPGNVQLRLFDITGRQVAFEDCGQTSCASLNTSNCNPGLYLLQLSCGQQSIRQKLIIER